MKQLSRPGHERRVPYIQQVEHPRGRTMQGQVASLEQAPGGSVFTSDLSLKDQRKQLMFLIDDFSDRLRKFEDGPEKAILFARLVRLQEDLLNVQDALKSGKELHVCAA
jgi:hypothetical protein